MFSAPGKAGSPWALRQWGGPITSIAHKTGTGRSTLRRYRRPRRADLAENGQRRFHLAGADAQRRAETDRALATAEQQESLMERRLDQLVARRGARQDV